MWHSVSTVLCLLHVTFPEYFIGVISQNYIISSACCRPGNWAIQRLIMPQGCHDKLQQKLGGLKLQWFILSQFWKSKGWHSDIIRAVPWKAPGDNLLIYFQPSKLSFWWPWAFLDLCLQQLSSAFVVTWPSLLHFWCSISYFLFIAAIRCLIMTS